MIEYFLVYIINPDRKLNLELEVKSESYAMPQIYEQQ